MDKEAKGIRLLKRQLEESKKKNIELKKRYEKVEQENKYKRIF